MVASCITSYACIQVNSYLPHECLPVAVVESLGMCLDLRGQGKAGHYVRKEGLKYGIAGTTRCMCESRSHNDELVDELLISSLSVQRVLKSKRRTPIGPREFSQVRTITLTCGNQTLVLDIEVTFQLLSNRSAVETHEAEMHLDVTLRPQFSKRD
jgi:hypothetical protein